jgi:hypothetical protein
MYPTSKFKIFSCTHATKQGLGIAAATSFESLPIQLRAQTCSISFTGGMHIFWCAYRVVEHATLAKSMTHGGCVSA